MLIARLTFALGPTACTPEWVMAPNYRETRRLERARYRVWRWRCPACGGGDDDPDRIWRPLAIDSRGSVWCEAGRCTQDEIARAVRHVLELERLLGGV